MAKLNFTETPVKGAFVIEPDAFVDHRGFFARMFCVKELKAKGLNHKIVQANHSKSVGKGTIRGLHYQLPPNAETKIVKCIKGKIFDVIVDVRKDSPTFLHWFGVELTADNKKMLYIPEGFAHGFQALEEEVEIIYLVTNFYAPEAERGVRYNDQKINIEWPIKENIITSEKDEKILLLDENFTGIELNLYK
jgi:dTDP-4-dehydrorhamnose 3,5-epimerase